jgi:hypothetical protein
MPYCAKCGHELSSPDEECQFCAQQQQPAQPQQPTAQPPLQDAWAPAESLPQPPPAPIPIPAPSPDGWKAAQPAPPLYAPPPGQPGSFAGPSPAGAPWAMWSMILGIVSILCCPISAPFAIWAGVSSNRQGEGSGMALAGIILGVLGVLGLIGLILMMVLGGIGAFVQGVSNSSDILLPR